MKSKWLAEADEITSSDRQRDYGRPLMNFLRIALDWNINDAGRRIQGDYITPLDVVRDMIGMKKARDLNMFKDDNWIDTIGYSRCVEDMNDQMQELGYSNGVKAFEIMNIQGLFDLLCKLIKEDVRQDVMMAFRAIDICGDNARLFISAEPDSIK